MHWWDGLQPRIGFVPLFGCGPVLAFHRFDAMHQILGGMAGRVAGNQAIARSYGLVADSWMLNQMLLDWR